MAIVESDYRPLQVRILSDPAGPIKPQRDGSPSAKGFGGVVPIASIGDRTPLELDALPSKLRIPMDYAREHHWVEVVDQKPVSYPGGTVDDPWRNSHTTFHASKIVLHMRDGDVEYRIVRQPGKYDSAGVETSTAGDPTASVYWDYLVEKVA